MRDEFAHALAEVEAEEVVELDPTVRGLVIGSDVEIAQRLRHSLRAKFGHTPYV
jgi:hypothetical protein